MTNISTERLEEMRPCPFCGNTAVEVQCNGPSDDQIKMALSEGHDWDAAYFVACYCGCTGPERAEADAAIAGWNLRCSATDDLAKPAYWAVHSVTGVHIGLWPKVEDAMKVWQEYPDGKLTPLYASPQPNKGEVVKPLEWKGPDENTAYGEQGGFIYTVMSPNRTPGWRVWVHLKSLSKFAGSVGGIVITAKAENREAAMAAAQADYETRIRSALVSQPAPKEITDEMVERAYEAFVAACEWSDWDEPEVRGYVRAALEAAMKEASNG